MRREFVWEDEKFWRWMVVIAVQYCFPIVVLEKALESSLHCKEIKPVNPKGNLL